MDWVQQYIGMKYSPDQPRVPAGDPSGGQWAGGSGSSGLPTEQEAMSVRPWSDSSPQHATVVSEFVNSSVKIGGDIEGDRQALMGEIDRQISMLPSDHLNALGDVKVDVVHTIREYNGAERPSAGSYLWTTNQVHVREQYVAHAMNHELGHSLFDNGLSREAQAGWQRHWETHLRDMPSSRARASANEGFAECYKIFSQGVVRGRYGMGDATYDLMKDLFSGNPGRWQP